MVEPQAAALAAVRRSEDDLQAMASALEGMGRHGLASKAGREADQAFHAALLRATGNAFVASLIAGVGAAVTWTTFYKGTHSRHLRDSLPDHQRVYDALAKRDPAAARAAMTELVELALRDTTDAGKRVRGRRKTLSA
jgi:DNA-binding FadR family transcriptional regulator